MKTQNRNPKVLPSVKTLLSAMVIAFLVLLTSCNDDDETPDILEQDIVAVAVANGYNVLAAALTEADLISTLQGAGPFTVFAPTDAAFASAGINASNVSEIDDATLEAILKYHVVSGNITSSQLTTGSVNTVEGSAIEINAENLTVNNANIIDPFDVEASNGVIHTIDAVLELPEEEEMPTQSIVEIAQGNNDLTILVDALTKFPDLVDALSNDGTYTVFAPTNDAFVALLGVIGQTELDDIPENVLERVLKYHVVTGVAARSTDLSDGQEIPTFLSSDDIVTVGIDGSTVTTNTSTVAIPNVLATNGVVHVVDQVLVPELEGSIVNTVVEPAYFNKDFTVLTEAVVTADLLGTLTNPEAELTVFAPTNAAFEAAGITTLDGIEVETLAGILQYHVLGSEVVEEDLPETGSAVETLNGDFYLSINADGVFINGLTQVVATDIEADNGVVHVIDRMLEPASSDVVDIAIAASENANGAEFTQLVAALTAVSNETNTDLVAALKADGPFTVFAPTDAAFQTLYDAIGDENMDGSVNISDLVAKVGYETIATVLQYHVLDMRVFSTDIPNALDGSTSATLTPLVGGTWTLNDDLTITPADEALGLQLDDAEIVGTDILGTNGVIHTINQVILP